MQVIPGGQAERYAFIDRTLEEAKLAFETDAIRDALGDRAVTLTRLLETTAVANVRFGAIEIPDDIDESALLIMSIEPNEELFMPPDFHRQTKAQYQNTIEKIKAWNPKKGKAEAFYDRTIKPDETRRSVIASVGDAQQAQTGSTTTFISFETDLKPNFSSAPRGITWIKGRPILMIKRTEGLKFAQPDIVAHEFTHFEQMLEEPISSFSSQRSMDLSLLKNELEAHHVGSLVTAERIKAGGEKDALRIAQDPGFINLRVESARRGYIQSTHSDENALYATSPEMLAYFREKGLGHIFGLGFTYDEIEDRLKKRSKK